MTDLDEQLQGLARHAAQMATPPAFDDLRAQARHRRRAGTVGAVAATMALTAVVTAVALVWPPVSAPPADHNRPPGVSPDRFLRLGDFTFGGFQAAEDPGRRGGHPVCRSAKNGSGRTAQWREYRTFDQVVRAYQLVISYADSNAARRATARLVDDCTGMLTGDTAISSQLSDSRGNGWRVRHQTTRPFLGEVSAVGRVGEVVTVVWIRGLHRTLTTDGYAQMILETMQARLSGVRTRYAPLPPDPLSAAMLTEGDVRAATGRKVVLPRHPAVFRPLHVCQPVPRPVIEWRAVQYLRYDWQPLLDERVSIAADSAAAKRAWARLVSDVTGCAAGSGNLVVAGPSVGDDSVYIGEPEALSGDVNTVVVRVGRVVVEIVLWESAPGRAPTTADMKDVVATAITRIRTELPEEAAGG